MSNFSKHHSLPTYDQRKEAIKGRRGTTRQRWLKVDHVIDQIYCDLCNGLTKSDILMKLIAGTYEDQAQPLKERTAYEYIAAAQDRMTYNFEAKAEEMRVDLYNKLMTIYADAIKANDRFNAVVALDKIMKLTGVAMDKPQNNIQVNANKEGITINFGFSQKEEENTTE